AWGGVVKQEADRYGMKFVSQDPNWSTDAMAQALTNIIAQKPDVIVTQNPDLQSLARLLKQARTIFGDATAFYDTTFRELGFKE
ncbi:MAG: hypothetical protein WCQ57_14770, partial [Verrucomicrobiota bacterium]